MKNLLVAVAIVSSFAACNGRQDKTAETTVKKDSSALDSLAAANDQSELIEASGIPDTFVTSDGSVFARVKP